MSTCSAWLAVPNTCPSASTANDGATVCDADPCNEDECCTLTVANAATLGSTLDVTGNTALAGTAMWSADENEGQLRMFVVMVLVGLSVYIWNVFNGCMQGGSRKKIWMTFVMATLTTFMIITLWFGDVYWHKGDQKHYVNGVPFLTKNRPHYLHDSTTIHNCMANDTDSKSPALSETQRNLRHFVVAAGIGALGSYAVSFVKAGPS